MKTLGLIGNPVKQSQSDIYHNRFLSHIGFLDRYEKFELSFEELPQFITNAKRNNMIGLSVTMPFKEQIIPLLDEIDETAQRIGAVNTVKFINGKSYGYNTDGKGALQAIQHIDHRPLNNKYAVIVGAGGAAKAIAQTLSHAGMKITIVNRHFEKASVLAQTLKAQALPLSQLASAIKTKCDLLIQATSVGMLDQDSIIPAHAIPSHMTVLDVLSAPKNQWLEQLAQQGALTVSGRLMWIFQAIEQYKIWFPLQLKPIPPNEILRNLSLNLI